MSHGTDEFVTVASGASISRAKEKPEKPTRAGRPQPGFKPVTAGLFGDTNRREH
jgi:hypothetical protein